MDNKKTFPTKLQDVHALQEGQGFDEGENYNIASYKEMADAFYKSWIKKHHEGETVSLEQVAKDYWDMVETRSTEATVEYANDIDTAEYCSGFQR